MQKNIHISAILVYLLIVPIQNEPILDGAFSSQRSAVQLNSMSFFVFADAER
jgi:hypothetical protein